MPRIALIGPGAIGCTVLAHLARDRSHELVVGARTPFSGVSVETPDGTITFSPRVLTDPACAAAVDWVIVAVKTYDAAGAAPWLTTCVGPHTRVAVLQNGVEHRARFAGLVSAGALVPVIIDCPCERIAPGVVRQRGPGSQVIPDTPAGAAYAALFRGTAMRTETTSDWTSAAWRKLCINSPGAVSALLLQPAGISRDDGVAEVMRGMIREVIAVGRAEGAIMDDAIVEEVIAGYRNASPDAVNSLHADRLAGRRMEYEARNGVVARLAQAHGLAAPLNAMAAALLRAAERAARPAGGGAARSSRS